MTHEGGRMSDYYWILMNGGSKNLAELSVPVDRVVLACEKFVC